uniref:MATH domain-containing protein n=1 Tax=Cacopsylla melanoneura TaxID=428564 RepID=A0A8D8X1Y3_9HEMI
MNIEDSDLNKKDDSLNADDDDSIHDKMDNISKGTAIVDVKEETMNIEDNDLNEKDESLNAEDSEEIQSAILDKRNKCKETLKSFCENVLISLLGHIRMSEISAKVWMASYKTDWFKKYSDYLQKEDSFSNISKPRQKYAEVTSVGTSDDEEGRHDAGVDVLSNPVLSNDATVLSKQQYEEIKNTTKTFTIPIQFIFQMKLFKSNEEYLLGGRNWKLEVYVCRSHLDDDEFNDYEESYGFYMELFRSDSDDQSQNEWETFTGKCQLKWI